jgi:hypothetical protein
MIKYKGVIKNKQLHQIDANQFNIFIPVGIAIIAVEKVKYDLVSISKPTINI